MRSLKAPLRTFLFSLLVASPATSEVWQYGEAECNQLWFMRNLIMDRAGYCFGSNLGKALYDNGDCTGKQVTLTQRQQRQVAKIQKLEREIGCKVNNRQQRLDLPTMAALRRLRDMPLPDNGGSACIGWQAGDVPLRAGHGPKARQIGKIQRGDTVFFGYINEGDWIAVLVTKGGRGREVLGWTNASFPDSACETWAG